MVVTITLNGKKVEALVKPDTLLIDFVRDHGCYSVKRGCETSNCGLCTVFVNDKPVLSCSMLVARVNGCKVDTLEGLQKEAEEFGAFIADQGAEQCGFCNPGMIMNAIALFRENPDPSDEEIKEYLAGNLLQMFRDMKGQMRGNQSFSGIQKRMGGADESSKSANSKKRCHGAGDRKTGFYGRSGSEGLSDRQITAQSPCQCNHKRNQ
ncbi:MAG: (2Fe-2S)-binding protein [Eubacterium sp.]